MKKFLSALILLIMSLSILFICLAPPVVAASKTQGLFNSSMEKTAGETGYLASSKTKQSAQEMVGSFIKLILTALGVAFLVLIIYGGFKWMLARDNEQDVTKAKSIIRNAVIGLTIVMAAYAITAYVGSVLQLDT